MFGLTNPLRKFASYELPGQIGIISLPRKFRTVWENDATLLSGPRQDSLCNIRISGFSLNDTGPATRNAISTVRKNANDKGIRCYRFGDKVYTQEAFVSSDNNGETISYRWEVGHRKSIVHITLTVPESEHKDRITRNTLAIMPRVVKSIHINRNIPARIQQQHSSIPAAPRPDPDPATRQIHHAFSTPDYLWLKNSLNDARQLCQHYDRIISPGPAELDRLYSDWLNDYNQPLDRDRTANALGAALGEYLVREHDFKWVVVEDKYGIEKAVYHPANSTVAYPVNSIRKRIRSRRENFIEALHTVLIDALGTGRTDVLKKG